MREVVLNQNRELEDGNTTHRAENVLFFFIVFRIIYGILAFIW